MMQIDIVTVYNTENCGSVLQAYALKRWLEVHGHHVRFIRRSLKGTPGAATHMIVNCARRLMHMDIRGAKARFRRYRSFHQFYADFEIVDPRHVGSEDMIIYGSDTLWNVANRYFASKRDVYWGKTFPEHRKITYAVSIGNTAPELLKEPYYKDCIDGFSVLSVRDEWTREAVKQLTEREVALTCDPTLLLKKDDYIPLAVKNLEKDRYLLLYYFGDFDRNQQRVIRSYAAERGLKIISFGAERSWCDKRAESSPQNFLTYFAGASCVITNTFHGCVFSVIFEKKMIGYVEHLKKAAQFLKEVGIGGQIVPCTCEDLSRLDEDIDYVSVGRAVTCMAASSENFLLQNIGSE